MGSAITVNSPLGFIDAAHICGILHLALERRGCRIFASVEIWFILYGCAFIRWRITLYRVVVHVIDNRCFLVVRRIIVRCRSVCVVDHSRVLVFRRITVRRFRVCGKCDFCRLVRWRGIAIYFRRVNSELNLHGLGARRTVSAVVRCRLKLDLSLLVLWRIVVNILIIHIIICGRLFILRLITVWIFRIGVIINTRVFIFWIIVVNIVCIGIVFDFSLFVIQISAANKLLQQFLITGDSDRNFYASLRHCVDGGLQRIDLLNCLIQSYRLRHLRVCLTLLNFLQLRLRVIEDFHGIDVFLNIDLAVLKCLVEFFLALLDLRQCGINIGSICLYAASIAR